MHIQGQETYKKCMLLLENKDKVDLINNDVADIQKLSTTLTTININISFLLQNYIGIMRLFYAIDKLLTRPEHKKSLYRRLNQLLKEYSILIEDYDNKNGVGYALREFVMITLSWNVLRKSKTSFDNSFLAPYSIIKRINDKYDQ
jgi:tRNA-dihydrouridine synthase